MVNARPKRFLNTAIPLAYLGMNGHNNIMERLYKYPYGFIILRLNCPVSVAKGLMTIGGFPAG
jgi:hypothetical protein